MPHDQAALAAVHNLTYARTGTEADPSLAFSRDSSLTPAGEGQLSASWDQTAGQIPLAFLVDGDNASAKTIGEMLAEVSNYGTVIIRKVYGDWTSTHLSQWKQVFQKHSLHPEQQFANTSGKNATDSAMIIDAMDMLHQGIVKGFVLVSSDSDFSALARRIREAGLLVIGIGRADTPESFRSACHRFVSTENLVAPIAPSTASEEAPESAIGPTRQPPTIQVPPPRAPTSEALTILDRAFETADRGDGVVHLAYLGETLYRLDSAFDARTYGKAKLVDLILLFPHAYTIERPLERGPGAVYVRRRKA